MKAIKIPRTLKKALKKEYLKGANPAWKTSDVKIFGIRNISGKKRNGLARVGNITISHCTLG